MFLADRVRDFGKMRGDRLCASIDDAWCSNADKVDTVSQISDFLCKDENLIYHHYLVATVYIPPNANSKNAL